MYRHIQATKRLANGKVKRYKNLAAFNKECPSRGFGGNICTVTNLRCTKDGGGLATVKSSTLQLHTVRGQRPPGTWLLHFASCSVLKAHLRPRAGASRSGLFGARRRRRRR